MKQIYVTGKEFDNKIEISTYMPIMDALSLKEVQELKKNNKTLNIYKLVKIK